MTSEAQRDLPPQPEDTCPMIDGVIDSLDTIKKYMKKYDRIDDITTLHSMLYDIEWDLDLDDDFGELIRISIDRPSDSSYDYVVVKEIIFDTALCEEALF
jgi:hypothetical protein